MEKIALQDVRELILDNKEIEAQVKLPYDEDLLTEKNQPQSPFLTGLSNQLGVLVYALDQRLAIINHKGLMRLCKQAKGKENDKIERPTFDEMAKNGELLTVTFQDAAKDDGPIVRILLQEEFDDKGKLLAVGFETKVFVLDLAKVLAGDKSYLHKFDLPKGSKLKTFGFIDDTCLVLNDNGQVSSVGGDVNVGELNTTPILDLNCLLYTEDFVQAKLVAVLDQNKKSASIFRADESKTLKKLNKIDVTKTSLEFTPVNVRLLQNGALLILGYQYYSRDDINSYAAIVAVLDKILSKDSAVSFKEAPDILPLATNDYPEQKDDLEFKVVNCKTL